MASPTPYATNAFAVETAPIDYAKEGSPTTMSYHGGTIAVGNNIIGRINEFQPAGAYNREASHVYEVNHKTWGNPVDIVPGRNTGFNATFTRTEVWEQEFEKALGYGAVWDVLTDQNYPFKMNEMLFKGSTIYRNWLYRGCWLTEKNPNAWSAEGDGKVTVNCNTSYVTRRRVT